MSETGTTNNAIKQELLWTGTTFKQDGINVVQTSPNGLKHTINDTNLEQVSFELRQRGYSVRCADETTIRVVQCPPPKR